MTINYLICSTPQTGSNLLTNYLKQVQICGNPGEYFFKNNEIRFMREWGMDEETTSYDAYVRKAAEFATSPNEVRGFKIMQGHFTRFLNNLQKAADQEFESELELLDYYFPEPKFIWTVRDNKVRQAIDWTRKAQEDKRSEEDDKTLYYYEPNEIEHYHQWAVNGQLRWERFFAENNITPIIIKFEEFLADPKARIIEILNFLGISYAEEPEFLQNLTPPESVRNMEVERWYYQFLYDKGFFSEKALQYRLRQIEQEQELGIENPDDSVSSE